MLTRDDQKNEVFKIAKQMTKTNQDIIGEKCVRDDTGEMISLRKQRGKVTITNFLIPSLNGIEIVCQQLNQLLVQP